MDKFLVRKDVYETLKKAFGNRSNLKEKIITDKNGHQKKVWVRAGEEQKKQRYKKIEPTKNEEKESPGETIKDSEKSPEEAKENKPKYDIGANVTLDSIEGDFKINSIDKDGSYHVISADGKKYHVSENHIKARSNNTDDKNKGSIKQLTPTYGRKQIPANEFNASKYKQLYDDDKVDTTYSGIEEGLRQAAELPIIKRHSEFMMKLRNDLRKAEEAPETVSLYRISGSGAEAEYTPERRKIHKKIIDKLISEKLEAAMPKNGEAPTFQILGGRGGSGKSTFNKKKSEAGVYHEDNVIVVDPDALKQELANESKDGWEGWKAKAYHEESSDVSKMLMKEALAFGLNIVMDITMSNADTQIDELKLAKSLGYKTGAYYMHVPKQESFKRAMSRYVQSETEKGVEDFSGRLVPPDVLLGMTENEANFDKVKDFADDWSFYDNFIPFEKDPATGKNKYQAEKIAQKGE